MTLPSSNLYLHIALTLSVLEAANSDLASLINRLDLEATPDSKASRPVSFAVTDPTTSTRLTVGEPESPARGGADDSPLKKLTGAGARTQASVTSLRPYSYLQGQGGGDGARIKALAPSSDGTSMRASGNNNVIVGRAEIPPVPPLIVAGKSLGQPIVPWSSLVPKDQDHAPTRDASKDTSAQPAFPTLVRKGRLELKTDVGAEEVQPLRPPKHRGQRAGETVKNTPPVGATGAAAPRIRTSSSEIRARAAPFMRTPSVISTFGPSVSNAGPTHTPSTHDAIVPSSHTFGGSRPAPGRYTLPSLASGSSSPRSVMTAGTETPTPSPQPQRGGRGRGHVRRGSSLVPFVKRAVQSIEARTAIEMEEQQRLEERVKRRSGGGGVGVGNNVGTIGATAQNEGMDAEARRELGFKGTMGVADGDAAESVNEEDEDSDIPDELQVILSQSDDTRTSKIGDFPTDAVEDTLSFVPPTNDKAARPGLPRLPPSPGSPPTGPLPTPSSTSSVLLSPTMEPSPPAPTFLPFLAGSPTPSPPSVPVSSASSGRRFASASSGIIPNRTAVS